MDKNSLLHSKWHILQNNNTNFPINNCSFSESTNHTMSAKETEERRGTEMEPMDVNTQGQGDGGKVCSGGGGGEEVEGWMEEEEGLDDIQLSEEYIHYLLDRDSDEEETVQQWGEMKKEVTPAGRKLVQEEMHQEGDMGKEAEAMDIDTRTVERQGEWKGKKEKALDNKKVKRRNGAAFEDGERRKEAEGETGLLAKLLNNLSDKVMRGNEGGKKVAKKLWRFLGKGKNEKGRTERGKMEKGKKDGGEGVTEKPKGTELGAGSLPIGTSTAREERVGASVTQAKVGECQSLELDDGKGARLSRSTSNISLTPLSEETFRKRKASSSKGRDKKRFKPNPLTLEHKLKDGFKNKHAPYMAGEQRVLKLGTREVKLVKSNIRNEVSEFDLDTRMFLIRNSNNSRGEGATNNTGTYWHGECDVCKDKHKTDKSPRVLFLGDQSLPAIIGGGSSCCLVERMENATLDQLGDLMENLVKDGVRARHLKLAPGSLIVVFSLSELLRLGTWAYFRELDILKGRIQRALMDAGMSWKNLPTVAAGIFPCCTDSPDAEDIYSDYYNALVAHRNLDTNKAKVVLVDMEPLSDHLSWSVGDRICLTSCDRISFSPNMCLVTVRSKLHVRRVETSEKWGERGISAELEYKWLSLVIEDIRNSTDLADMARLQLPTEEDLKWGVAQHYNPLLTNKVRPDVAPKWVNMILEKDHPKVMEDEDSEDPGRIVLIGTSNARKISIEMEKKGLNVSYIPAMKSDMETAEYALARALKLELGAKDRIVIAMFGNSYIRSRAGEGKKGPLHLEDPRELQDFEVDNLTGSVSWLVSELDKRFPLCGKVIYGPLPRYTPNCCVKHPNTGKFVIGEIKKVDLAMDKVVKNKGLNNTIFVSALDALDQGDLGNPSHLDPNDPIHLSDLGKRLMMGHIIHVIGKGEPSRRQEHAPIH